MIVFQLDVPVETNSALTFTVLGLGAIGILSGINVIVDWLKLLVLIEGQRVRWLVMGVTTFVVMTLVLSQYYPDVAVGFTVVYLICYFAGLADARYQQVTAAPSRLVEARQQKARSRNTKEARRNAAGRRENARDLSPDQPPRQSEVIVDE